jgi:tRNA A-37 threonylcarbamoyl transferase component Bud32/mRNA-degrading endonuclease RelE of RelBE toxin-antitoxin system|tara:strand:- start:2904 stop:3734 length:831 start_codon:yes stop_codon:yes gene_type:complete
MPKVNYSDELVPEALRKSAKPGAVYKNPKSGHTLQKQANGRWKMVDVGDRMKPKAQPSKPSVPDVSKMKKLAEGNYGIVYKDDKQNRVVKTLKEGKEWGPHEVELGKRMAELGHSPKVHSASDEHIEMDAIDGAPLWGNGYNRTPEEKERGLAMTEDQARKSLRAIRDLHKMGFYHGDMHNQQFMTDGEGGSESTLIDYGLSGKIEENPTKAIIDFNKVYKLIDIDRPELDKSMYAQLVRTTVRKYQEAKGQSKAAKQRREEIAREYIDRLSAVAS